jgi:HEAT repeat protein
VVWWAAALAGAAAPIAAEEAGNDVISLIVELLQDRDKDIRALGLEQVRSQAKGRAATHEFAAVLPNLTPDAQIGLLGALADRGDTAARPAVLEALANSHATDVHVAAIAALGPLGEPADVPRLVQILSEASEAEQMAARRSLVRLAGDEIPRAIAAEMEKAPPPVRVALIEVLAARRAVNAIDDILSAAVDADPHVRTAAMAALGDLAGPEHLSGMVQGVLKAEEGRERAAAEKAVMFVSCRIADPEQRAVPLLAVMDTLEDAERTALLPTLGRVGGAAAWKIVEGAVTGSDPVRHELGLIALCNWPDASVAEQLIEQAQTDEHPECRRRALRALIRVAPLPDGRSDAEKLDLLQRAMAMSTRDAERKLVLERARAIRTPQTLRFVMQYLDEPTYAEQICQTVVELAHHRNLREPNKAEFDRALDQVLKTSQDATVLERATRYKNGQTWARPTSAPEP